MLRCPVDQEDKIQHPYHEILDVHQICQLGHQEKGFFILCKLFWVHFTMMSDGNLGCHLFVGFGRILQMVTIWTVGLSLLNVQEGGIDGLSTCPGMHTHQTTKFRFYGSHRRKRNMHCHRGRWCGHVVMFCMLLLCKWRRGFGLSNLSNNNQIECHLI